MTYLANQGNIINVDFNPKTGVEQRGKRPYCRKQQLFNQLSNIALVCSITNTSTDFPLNVNLNEQTKTTGSILCQHIRSLDLKARNALFVEKVPKSILQETINIIHGEL